VAKNEIAEFRYQYPATSYRSRWKHSWQRGQLHLLVGQCPLFRWPVSRGCCRWSEWKNAFWGVPKFDVLVRRIPWTQGPKIKLMKTTFNVKNFLRRLFWSICSDFSAVRCCVADRNRQKPIKPLFWRSGSFKVIDFGANRKPAYDFLLVINSYFSAPYLRYATYMLKSQIFLWLLFSALAESDSFRIYGRALRVLKLESSRQPMVKIWWS